MDFLPKEDDMLLSSSTINNLRPIEVKKQRPAADKVMLFSHKVGTLVLLNFFVFTVCLPILPSHIVVVNIS